MKNYFDAKFGDSYQRLPPYAKKPADRTFEHFALDIYYPSLELKCVNQQRQKYSIRINKKGYRALGYIRGDDMLWEWIGPHDEYMRKIRE